MIDLSYFIDDFLGRAWLAGIMLAALCGPFGCLVIWRRLSYFTETLAHASLSGVAIGLVFSIYPIWMMIGASLITAFLLDRWQHKLSLATDNILGLFAPLGMAVGILLLNLFRQQIRVDIMAILLGDILAVNPLELAEIALVSLVALGLLCWRWRPIFAAIVNHELAEVEGLPVKRDQLLYTSLLAIIVALAVKLVGILLVTSLLIMPALAARYLTKTPESMAIVASIAGMIAVTLGLAASLWLNLPSGPTIVVVSFLLFLGAAGPKLIK